MQITHKVGSRDNYFISLVSRYSGKWFQGGFADCTFQNTNSEMETNTGIYEGILGEWDLLKGREWRGNWQGERWRCSAVSKEVSTNFAGSFPRLERRAWTLTVPRQAVSACICTTPRRHVALGKSLFLILEIPKEELQLTSVFWQHRITEGLSPQS